MSASAGCAHACSERYMDSQPRHVRAGPRRRRGGCLRILSRIREIHGVGTGRHPDQTSPSQRAFRRHAVEYAFAALVGPRVATPTSTALQLSAGKQLVRSMISRRACWAAISCHGLSRAHSYVMALESHCRVSCDSAACQHDSGRTYKACDISGVLDVQNFMGLDGNGDAAFELLCRSSCFINAPLRARHSIVST